MGSSTHIIGRQAIRMHYNGTRDPFELQQIVRGVCSDELPIRLNKLLDQYDDKDFEIRIDRLHIDVSISDSGDLHEALAKAITEKVEAALLQKLDQRGSKQALSAELRFTTALLKYLVQGYLPRFSIARDPSAFRQAVRQNWDKPQFLKSLVPEILPVLQSDNARVRLAELLDWDQLEAFALASGDWSEFSWKDWQTAFSFLRKHATGHSPSYVDKAIQKAILDVIADNPEHGTEVTLLSRSLVSAIGTFDTAFQKLVADTTLPATLRMAFQKALRPQESGSPFPVGTPVQKDPQSTKIEVENADEDRIITTPTEEESIFIQNSGIVILALYMPAFFANIGLVGQGGKPDNIARAIALLRYLVYEDETFTEMEVVIEKLLCGIPLSQSISGYHVITDVEKEKAEELLNAVIAHWTVLKNSSPAGLRHNFLQREGKLTFRNNQWYLTVQKQPQDILIDYLPWNISLIKLQWMPHMISVKWNT
jgi:hypothetical protein